MKYIGIHIFIFLISSSFHSFASSVQEDSYIICQANKKKRYSRILSNINGEKGTCKLLYTKGGKDRVSAIGKYKESCEQAQVRLTKVLEDAGWKCEEKKEMVIFGAVKNLSGKHL